MKNQLIRIKKNFRGLIIASLLILVFPLYLSAQDFWEATVRIDEEMQLIGGPYTTDEHTVLLLHFENNLDNVSTLSADGEAHGNLTYGDNTVTGFGKCLQIDNDAAEDLSYVTVADTAALDLTGDWTIEGWFNIATIGEAWMTDPRLIAKPGDSPWYNMNFYINLLEGGILSGFRGTSAWPEVTAPNSSLTLGEWLHVTYMHDSTKCLNIQMIHNAAKELIYFNYKQYDAGQNPPLVSDQSVSIGFGGGGNNSYLNGSVDEIRISNVLRDFAMPPIPLSQDVTVRFSVNMTNAVSYQTGEPFENLQSVFLNGDFCCESGWCGWTLDDTTSLIRLYDDGTNGGDVTADDNIWTTEVQFYDGDASANSYKYGAYDPDNMNLESLVPMDNEAGWGDDHSITIDDSSPLYIPPTDTWATIGTGSAPTVITLAETNITSSGVTLNGIVNPNGLSTTVIFEYGETTSYGDQITAEQSPLTGSSSVTVSANLSGLSDNTEYHYRVVATNSAGTANGADLTFTTLQSGSAPTTTTEAATDVSTTSATLNGTVNPNELSTTVIFEYGETASYGSQITADQSPVSGTTDVTVSANL
ncbi:MAG: hypothetical protein KAU06_10295, partial [Candidatus Marinimicrobia bacterium]|nr:hypothetical protein [Candidatus Neomarinimicrobiota bacterium]